MESNIPHAQRSLPCVSRTLIDSFCPLQMWSQILRILIFHPLYSNRSRSDERALYLRPDRKFADEAIVLGTRGIPLSHIKASSYKPTGRNRVVVIAIQFYITAFARALAALPAFPPAQGQTLSSAHRERNSARHNKKCRMSGG